MARSKLQGNWAEVALRKDAARRQRELESLTPEQRQTVIKKVVRKCRAMDLIFANHPRYGNSSAMSGLRAMAANVTVQELRVAAERVVKRFAVVGESANGAIKFAPRGGFLTPQDKADLALLKTAGLVVD